MSERKGEVKRQHFVPRMILRNFSQDGKRISLDASGRRVDGASLKGQCYEDYLYGADNVLEKEFADQEGRVAALLAPALRGDFSGIGAAERAELRTFVVRQQARTTGTVEHHANFRRAFMRGILEQTIRLNPDKGFTPADLDLVDISFSGVMQEAIAFSKASEALFEDMEVKLVQTSRHPGFIISDHPVVAVNQFAEHHPRFSRWPVITGTAVKGLQLFMPVAPSLAIAVFDPATYQYGGKDITCTAGPADVGYLNQIQAINALRCLYFAGERMSTEQLEKLRAQRASHRSAYDKRTAFSAFRRTPTGGSQMIAVSTLDIRTGGKLSFVRTVDEKSYAWHSAAVLPVRSAALLEEVRRATDATAIPSARTVFRSIFEKADGGAADDLG